MTPTPTPPQPDALREAITHILLNHSAKPLVAATDRILAAVTRELEEELKGTREVLAQRDEQLAKTTLECVQLEEALKGQLTTKGVKEIPLPEAFLASVREAVNERLERLHGDEYSIQQDTDWSAIGQQFVGREPKL